MSKKMRGIGASEGGAVAKALVLKEEEIIIKKQTVSDIDAEIAKLERTTRMGANLFF